jgi:hypothetical protein
MKLKGILGFTGKRALKDEIKKRKLAEDMKKRKEALKIAQEARKKAKLEAKRRKKEIEEEEARHKAHLEEEGLDFFLRTDSYIPAHPDEYEGHYPGNQRNTVVIPYKRKNHTVKELQKCPYDGE